MTSARAFCFFCSGCDYCEGAICDAQQNRSGIPVLLSNYVPLGAMAMHKVLVPSFTMHRFFNGLGAASQKISNRFRKAAAHGADSTSPSREALLVRTFRCFS